MRIGFDAKRAFHNSRGLGNYSRTLLQGLSSYSSENKYFLYTPKPSVKLMHLFPENILKGFQIRFPKGFSWNIAPSLWRSFGLNAVIKHDKIDIFHGLSHELPSNLIKINKTIKTVVTVHDLLVFRYPKFFTFIDRSIYRQKLIHSCKNADKIFAVSNQTSNDLQEFLKIPTNKISVLHQACHPRFYQNNLRDLSKKDILHRYSLPLGPFILMVGALEENKNHKSVIKALSYIKDKELTLVIIGQGRLKKEIFNEAKKRKILNRLQLIPFVPSQDLPSIYQLCKALVFPSFYEGFGLPIVECLASGSAVVTSRGGCFAEAGGNEAFYADPNDPESIAEEISRALKDHNAQEAKKHASQFNLQKTTKELLDLYQSVLS